MHKVQLKQIQFQQTAIPTIQSLRYSFTGSNYNNTSIENVIQMISELSRPEAQEFWTAMSQIHQCSAQALHEYYAGLRSLVCREAQGSFDSQSGLSSQSLSSAAPQPKQTATKVLKTQALLRAALAQVCRDFGKAVPSDISDRELCLLVNKTVEADSTQQFWNRVASMVPSKTKKQLYDFYRTCLSKVLFDAQISREDKLVIEQLNQAHPEMKPAALAELFLEESGRNLLKHDVVMQFVNLRKQQRSCINE
ncbi:SANT/Myb_domain [Hexamita inflata]|uniref:SANT/Myb domain n=1 Tax=Hexamita inflata TaxID=28002 RepID=A0AA86V5N5_9EUKA|nr:SANT/Myb domain [Hexamita inflata]